MIRLNHVLVVLINWVFDTGFNAFFGGSSVQEEAEERFNETLRFYLGLHEGKRGDERKGGDLRGVSSVFDLLSRTGSSPQWRGEQRKRPSKHCMLENMIVLLKRFICVTDYDVPDEYYWPRVDNSSSCCQVTTDKSNSFLLSPLSGTHCVGLCGRLRPLQFAKQTTNISLQICFYKSTRRGQEDGRGWQVRAEGRRRKERSKKASDRVDG